MQNDIKIALIARMDKTGLGIQTYQYFKCFRPHKTLVIDFSGYKPGKQHPEWYKDKGQTVKFHKGLLNQEAIDWITEDVDVILSMEIFYNYGVINLAKQRGVKTVLQYNAEFLDYFNNKFIPYPTMLLAPSAWKLHEVKALAQGKCKVEYLPLPIDREALPFRLRSQAKDFLHIAGMPTHMDRNGTLIFIEAMKHVKSDVNFIIRTQQELPEIKDERCKVYNEVDNYEDLYSEGDVFVMPRRYAGLCLPLNESLSTGMIPIMTHCSPQDLFLDRINLIAPCSSDKFMARTEIEVYNADPEELAERIDWLANVKRETIEDLSRKADKLATEWSWQNMRAKYLQLFRSLRNVKT